MEVSFLKQTAFEPKAISPINGNVSAANDTGIDDVWHGVDRELPIIDYTMFKSDDPARRSKVIQDLGKWCQEYGFFIVKNHPVPENLIKETIDKFMEFFDQTEEEKLKYHTRDPDDRIRFFQGDKNIISREFLYVTTHPTLHCPSEPPTLTETVKEFSGRVRELGIELLKGISESLGHGEDYIEKKLNLESSFDFLTVNDYPARQNSTNRLGQVEHSDTGLFTLVTQNTNGGLQLEHNGQWLNVNIKPNWIACNVADFLEILTNGKYKSVVHRVVLNSEVRRVTPPLFIGPALDTFVCPAPEFVDDSHPPGYLGMTYRNYLELNDHHVIDGRSWLQQIRL